MTLFDRTARAYELAPNRAMGSATEQRRLYALFRQATDGDVDESQPGLFEIEDQLNYRAWKSLQGMPEQQARTRFVDLARKLGFRDPGDSPVAWISDETWLREESWTNPDYQQSSPCIVDPRPLVVNDWQRRLAPELSTLESAEMPPRGTPDELRRHLESTPDTLAFHVYSPRWPICCQRPGVMVGFRGVDQDLEQMLSAALVLEEFTDEQWAMGEADEPDDPESLKYGQEFLNDDLALYHCSYCGSLYVAHHES